MWTSRRKFLAMPVAAAFLSLPMNIASANEVGKIRVTAASSDLNAMWVELAKEFERTHPGIKVELDNSNRSYDDLVQATLRDALTNSLPDVSFQGANRLRTYTDRNLAAPLGQFLDNDTSDGRKALSPAVAEIGAFKGDTYALGFGVAVPTVFYNLDLIAKAGGDPRNPPSTWDDILNLGKKITGLGDGNVGIVFQYDSADFFWDALLFSQGVGMMNADETKVTFDGPEGLKALEIIKAIGESGQAAVDMSKDQARAAFAAGKVGIIFDSNSNLPRFEEASAGHFHMEIGGFPLLSPEGKLPAAGSIAMMFATDPSQQKLAWEFLKFAAGPIGQKIVATKSGWLPANEYALRDSKELQDHFARNPHYKPTLDQVAALKGWYAFPGENALKVTQTIVDGMRAVITLKASPEDALADMSAKARKLLSVN
ncbi:ABC transporter substrate-binding protein [Sinorhizobium meliloti]|uniref:ABC transporter substrate-binding protein n=1 Tax=Rhizobium meliloti TaxID=382 RepID=UPI0018AD3BF0|nr:ABC transporter substrate-binding protein [Sinorhizobium meliloti]MDE4615960.1 ABC transporter substrate-binding protein [Sinorhizobium meliloti]